MDRELRDCPVCGEEIKAVAKKCRHCGEFLDERLRNARAGAGMEGLRRIAKYQKGILVCILVYFGAIVGQFAVPQESRQLVGLAVIPIGLIAMVFVFLLSTEIYSTGLGVVTGILTLVPCVGLLVLLVLNSKATSILTEQGIRVGLLGADMSKI